ncbi:MAG: MarR family transcriptional regulator [Rhizobiales bacterium]|nr:MarR family transcriptional regulator [Hyphomicrobiales bacterium]
MNRRDAVTELILETFRLNGRLLAAGDRLVADVGLTSARWQVLGAVAMSPVPLPVAHVARNMGLTRQAVQRLADELERDGLLCFEPNPHHQRAKLLVLTEKGNAAVSIATQRQGPWAEQIGGDSDAADIEAATAVLRAMRRRLEDDEAG